ncbi:hypothetical protein [Acetobacterium wieringae]|uniref:Clostridial hydrophobic W n=1 Tax=Acetobacterium wieringae TaxID=52694 RepID=A0A1F2PGL4_9FIRM|nr:hypothetical protein [Acetobacterium wieringae]OFV69851.1 clostridial hydrophobic W [Acetobacterium wieringae]
MKKLRIGIIVGMCMMIMGLPTVVLAEGTDTTADMAFGVAYRTHIENEGWAQGWMHDGSLSGSEGKGLRLEGIEIELSGDVPDGLGIQYQTHIQNKGWAQGWVSNGDLAGSVGEGLRLEAIEIKLTGTDAADYSIKYRTHIQNQGWAQGWVADGALSGSEGKGLRLEAIEIQIVETPVKVAFDKYEAVLGQVNEDDYTSASWDLYQDVVAKNVVTKEDIANKITEATTAIEKAQLSLVKKADLTIYNDVLESVKEADYSPETWAIYQAVVEANVVTEENTQAEVDAATIALIKAQKNLFKLADLTNYEAALAAVTQDMVKSGWTAYKAVVDANVVTNMNTQAEVDAATAKILAAQKSLVLYSDLTNFNKAIALYVQYGGDAANAPYTSSTWNTYTAKCENYGTLTDGKWVYDTITKDTAQSTIDAATADIDSAKLKLVKTADLTAFNAAKNIKVSDGPYTTASFTAYTNDSQVKAITTIAADTLKNYPQSVIDSYTATLIALQQTILVKGADLTAYNAALAAVQQANYTPASWTTYQTVVTANAVTPDNTQADVDAATAKIVAAQKNLVYSAAYVVANAKINTSNFGVRTVGDNILTRANDIISAAGIDKTDYSITFTRIDSGTAVINPTTGLIIDEGNTVATVTFTITPLDGGAAGTTANMDIYINP